MEELERLNALPRVTVPYEQVHQAVRHGWARWAEETPGDVCTLSCDVYLYAPTDDCAYVRHGEAIARVATTLGHLQLDYFATEAVSVWRAAIHAHEAVSPCAF